MTSEQNEPRPSPQGGLTGLCRDVEVASPNAIIHLAHTIEDNRDEASWSRMAAHFGMADAELCQTPFEYQAAIVAYEAGVFAFDRVERYFFRPAPADIHPDLTPDAFTVSLRSGRLETPEMWPFREDSPVADFERGASPRWWSHGLIHTLFGFAWWPEMTELELLHTARFSESVAAWHWYWLSDIGREYCPRHSGLIGETIGYCRACQGLDIETLTPEVRRRRIDSRFSDWLAASGLDFLTHEAEALRRGLLEGQLLIPPADMGLSVGDACEYARWNHRRTRGRGFRRWLEHCLVSGTDYSPDPDHFGDRCANVLARLLRWEPMPDAAPVAERAVRTLQDIGYRLCQAADGAGAPDRHQAALTGIADAIAQLRDDPEPTASEAILGESLALAAESWEREAPAAERAATPIFALGYRPTLEPSHEPASLRHARTLAAIRAMRSANIPAVFDELVDTLVSRERRLSSWLDDLENAVEPLQGIDHQVLLGWLRAIHVHLQVDPRVVRQEGWYYRLSLRRLPDDEEEWTRYRLRRIPKQYEIPGLFAADWLVALLNDVAALPCRFATRGERPPMVLVGVTPDGPLVEPLVGDTETVYELAGQGATLRDAVEATSKDAVDRALQQRLVAAVWD